ncbi:MAG: B12-binding domain-containing radical SAM protein [Deltaproteobacteria bacterium]|nr:B12-binding domain-containing radical SAM protein [Deltaproteobacteria bacterium]
MNNSSPNILLVNPWICDFAAYDFWAKPIGLLYIGSILKKAGYKISYIDCLDRFHPKAKKNIAPASRCGRGPYIKTKIDKPKGLGDVPKNFYRYGIKKEWFAEDLLSIKKPSLILVTSFMTYQYPGVIETISLLKDSFPDVPVILGGIYATLCFEHALKNSGADFVIKGEGVKEVLKLAEKYMGQKPLSDFNPKDFNSYPYPTFNLQSKIAYIPIMTSKGCPYACAYCASKYLNPDFIKRDYNAVVKEVFFWHTKFKVKDFVFYDDALLIDAKNHIIPMLEKIISKGYNIRFHTPNALHAKNISEKVASFMFKSGFHSIRIGLETADFENRKAMDNKITNKDFINAVTNLKKAGFSDQQIGAYLLTGLPRQSIKEMEAGIKFVKKAGVTPVLAYYTPIPHTRMWEDAVKSSRYDLNADPIYANNAIFPCMENPFSDGKISYLKGLASLS